jgi:probable phosphoglycerate mutase
MAEHSTKELLIIRHAESVANSQGILAGRIDPTPLSPKGKLQAKALQSVLSDFEPDLVVSSPMMRCRQTAKLAGAKEVLLDERLIEMDYGSWSGKKLKVLSKLPDWSRIQTNPQSFTFPMGESFGSVLSRIREFVDEITELEVKKIALFTHGDIARMLVNDSLLRELNGFQQIMIETSSHSRIAIRKLREPGHKDFFVHYINRRESTSKKRAIKFTLGGE